ncbi:MAG: hypothetical protein WAT74_14810 [Flavobacteriales bacterium]
MDITLNFETVQRVINCFAKEKATLLDCVTITNPNPRAALSPVDGATWIACYSGSVGFTHLVCESSARKEVLHLDGHEESIASRTVILSHARPDRVEAVTHGLSAVPAPYWPIILQSVLSRMDKDEQCSIYLIELDERRASFKIHFSQGESPNIEVVSALFPILS